MFSLESPQWGDANEYTQYTVFNIKKKMTLNYTKFAIYAKLRLAADLHRKVFKMQHKRNFVI